MIHTAQLLVEYHAREADSARRTFDTSTCPIARQRALGQLNWHRAALRRMDREAEAADAKARQETFLVRT